VNNNNNQAQFQSSDISMNSPSNQLAAAAATTIKQPPGTGKAKDVTKQAPTINMQAPQTTATSLYGGNDALSAFMNPMTPQQAGGIRGI
jgi:hypothetical protein